MRVGPGFVESARGGSDRGISVTSKESQGREARKRDGSDPSRDPDASPAGDTTTWATLSPPPVIRDEASPAPGEADADEMETVVVESAAIATRVSVAPAPQPICLERIAPSFGRGERLRLDPSAPRITLGRAEGNEIRLYTDSASRQHASIEGGPSGGWILTPVPGRSVVIDGEPITTPIVLEMGMNLVFGRDHLRCVAEGIDERAAAKTAAEGLSDPPETRLRGFGLRSGRIGWLIALVLFGSGLLFYILSQG